MGIWLKNDFYYRNILKLLYKLHMFLYNFMQMFILQYVENLLKKQHYNTITI